ncbi:hypothetical protein [Campylobacter upsaliensis]|uniref:hypothetical protein n=1 Tax=Campylobacter upsaliensis TaxID=28080 RepID=UPI0002D2E4AF|nr:hypothetical protein [Campylobacter upsaliensis]MCR2110569.1 hypothetical protein [Campylobacter upsaliensis]MCR2114108.1 hypothetical protein [Campylobacter upsaliensis]MCR2121167.1 hypothetical protein [Campylobacter upsaliensis]MCR2124755.1 hypothetical protein [Campylobacter upsaliensis]
MWWWWIFLQEALKLGRKFIGIDESIEAIKLNQKWLKESENHLFSHDIALIESFLHGNNAKH